MGGKKKPNYRNIGCVLLIIFSWRHILEAFCCMFPNSKRTWTSHLAPFRMHPRPLQCQYLPWWKRSKGFGSSKTWIAPVPSAMAQSLLSFGVFWEALQPSLKSLSSLIGSTAQISVLLLDISLITRRTFDASRILSLMQICRIFVVAPIVVYAQWTRWVHPGIQRARMKMTDCPLQTPIRQDHNSPRSQGGPRSQVVGWNESEK